MNILHLVPALETGGVETGTIDLATSLKKLGQTVVVVSDGGKLVKELEKNGILHIKLPIHKKSITSLLLVPEVMRILKRENIDIVHASSRVPAWIGFLACRLTKTPFVTSCHGFYSKHFLSSVMGRGKLVMVISETIKERMVKDFRVPENKIRLIYRGLDPDKFPYDPTKYDRNKERPVVINIGRLTPIKGQREFIKAMKHVINRITTAEAWLVGDGKEYFLDELKKVRDEQGMAGHIRFLGRRSDLKDLLKVADCLVLSTNVPEGFGRVLIEAGASGTACCASNTGGIREILEDGVSGLLFPPGDDVKMADSILKLLEDRALSKKYAGNLRKKIEACFTLDKMASETLSVYEEALRY